ncbi:MAG: B12-binding domain-containing radical SAM protein, partial [Phycisphaerae bacterium]|nr:B12-binding domain-containing radical SAM protein [Phycisphaerae bacterium]
MRIALVNPVTRRTQGYHTIGSYIPQLGLQVLAQLVPDGHQVDIFDEVFGPEATDTQLTPDRYDLVGITSYSSGATRAYEIADACRAKGIQTIMGGPHASACPDEADEHFDSIAIGECDEIWPEIVRDAARGQLQPRYQGKLSDLEALRLGGAMQALQPINGKYTVAAIQTSRGCPVGCEYCSVTRFNGPQIRRRPIADILDEWNRTPRKFIFVVDDNFFGVGPAHAKWAKELLRTIIKHGKKRLWFSQTTINMGDDPEGLRLAYKAGCRGMLVGFESFNRDSLKSYHKGINRRNLERYPELIAGFHRAGISVFGGFIIGSDDDTPETCADTAQMAAQMGVDIIQITNLTLLPGTKMYERYLAEGRVFATEYPKDWERYSFVETVYHPERMTARELDESIFEVRYAAAKAGWVWKRALRTLLRTRSLTTALFVHGMNAGWKRMARIQAP